MGAFDKTTREQPDGAARTIRLYEHVLACRAQGDLAQAQAAASQAPAIVERAPGTDHPGVPRPASWPGLPTSAAPTSEQRSSTSARWRS